MNGKAKCKILKEIRRKIAEENDIRYVTEECTHQGSCRGTCPKCEAELRYLEQELEKKRKLGKKITVAALTAGIAFLTACGAAGSGKEAPELHEQKRHRETLEKNNGTEVIELDGDVTAGEIPPEEEIPGEPVENPNPDEGIEELEGDVPYYNEEVPGEPVE